MSPHQHILGLIDSGSQVRRPPVIGMQFLHERPVRARNLFTRSALLKPESFIGFILRHRPRPSDRPVARIGIAISCLTPTGKPAVEISL